MLKKLLKHEFNATRRFFLPVYAGFAGLLVLDRLSMVLRDVLRDKGGFLDVLSSLLGGLLIAASVLAIIALAVSPLVYSVIRFRRNLLSDEGYLSFTLPVTPAQHLWTKLLTTVVWGIVTLIVAIACGILFFLTVEPAEVCNVFRAIGGAFSRAYTYIHGWAIVLPLLFLLALLTQFCNLILSLYNAMSIGQTANKHKLLISVAVFFGFNAAEATIIQIIGIGAVTMFGDTWITRFEQTSNMGVLTITSSFPFRFVCGILLAGVAWNVLMCVLHFFLSRYFLTKKLNLE